MWQMEYLATAMAGPEAPVAEHVEALGDDPVLFLVLAHGALDHLVHESKELRPKRQAGMQTN